jgi:hypothetical protein
VHNLMSRYIHLTLIFSDNGWGGKGQ